ncbi:MAG TPA: hypothetical protein VIJ94_07020 [Caulobacteraceae bacterium]
MSFQQKRALISLVVVWIAAVGYGVKAWRSPPSDPMEAALMLVAAAIGLTAMMIVGHILLVIGVGVQEAREPANETDRMARTMARRNASWIMAGGLWLIMGLALISASPVLVMQAAAAAFVLAEMVRFGSEMFRWRRSKDHGRAPQAL